MLLFYFSFKITFFWNLSVAFIAVESFVDHSRLLAGSMLQLGSLSVALASVSGVQYFGLKNKRNILCKQLFIYEKHLNCEIGGRTHVKLLLKLSRTDLAG